MFEQRRPTIIRDLSCVGASATLLKEQGLAIPQQLNLPDIMAFFDYAANIRDLCPEHIEVDLYVEQIKNLRCWVKHFYDKCNIPELTRIKALQRCMSFLIRVLKVCWKDYFWCNGDEEDPERQAPDDLRKLDYKILITTCLSLFDWLCVNDKHMFLFNEECGRTNLAYIITTCNTILS